MARVKSTVDEAIDCIARMNDRKNLMKVHAALRSRLDTVTRREAMKFVTGQIVEFEARGRTVRGHVKKVNVKTISVREEAGPENRNIACNWKVSPSLLRKV